MTRRELYKSSESAAISFGQWLNLNYTVHPNLDDTWVDALGDWETSYLYGIWANGEI